jgi:RNA polymerase primary sigma factor
LLIYAFIYKIGTIKTMSNDDNEDVLGIDLLSDMTELPESEFHILEEDLKLKVAKDVDYIKDTAKFIKLEPFEQLELTRIYKRSIIAKEMLNSGEKFNKKIKDELQNDVNKGVSAMEQLCASCWRLAWLIVREQSEKRFGKDKATELLPDIMQEANTALVQSIKDFDESKTPNFHTYAAQVMRNHTRMVLSKDSYLRLAPAWVRIKRIASAKIPQLATDLGRNPNKEEIQKSLLEYCMDWADSKLTPEQRNLPKPQREEIKMSKLRKQGMLGAIRDIDDVLIASQSPVSVDSPITADGPTTIGDMIVSKSQVDAVTQYEVKEMKKAISEALLTLTEREREVIVRRFGLDGDEAWTCAMLGSKYDVSSERIRQIERTALAKLSSPHGQYSNLSDFLHL